MAAVYTTQMFSFVTESVAIRLTFATSLIFHYIGFTCELLFFTAPCLFIALLFLGKLEEKLSLSAEFSEHDFKHY